MTNSISFHDMCSGQPLAIFLSDDDDDKDDEDANDNDNDSNNKDDHNKDNHNKDNHNKYIYLF